MLITFSGLDGAGKSTLVRWLQHTLERQHRRVVVFHMNDHVGVYAYLRRLRNQLGGAPPRAILGTGGAGALHRVRNALLWGKVLRRLIYPLDLLLFLAYRLYHEAIRRRVVIKPHLGAATAAVTAEGGDPLTVAHLYRLRPRPCSTTRPGASRHPSDSLARQGDFAATLRPIGRCSPGCGAPWSSRTTTCTPPSRRLPAW